LTDEPAAGAEDAEQEAPPKKAGGVLKRSTKIQLVLFVVITLLGISYVSAEYVGLTKVFGSSGCTIHADFQDSGGIFTNAEVTYRGVTVGKVGSLHLIPHGVRVDLLLDDCSTSHIPADADARVADRSVVGEQYVDLLPHGANPPYFRGGEIVPMTRTSIPTATETLLINLDRLVRSVNTRDLRTTITELGSAFNDRGADLGKLLDSTNTLVNAARANLPATTALIDQASTVLQTQLDEGPALRSFSVDLDLLAQQLRTSNADITHLLDAAPGDLLTLRQFLAGNRTDLAVTFANLVDIGELLVRHKAGIEQILEFYPIVANAGPTVSHDNRDALGVVLQTTQDPPDCGDPAQGREGYEGTTRRTPDILTPIAPNAAAHCTAPLDSGVNVRGSANIPGGDPISVPGHVPAYPRPATSDVLLHGGGIAGTPDWLAVLTGALN
jgi:phospholipid/cholesterol/gamma-HCH transport system substrate-binding protein